MHTAQLAFFSQISDPRFGGTYMTLLNTLSNLATVLSSTSALGLVDLLTFKECSHNVQSNCSTTNHEKVSQYIITTI